MEKMRVADHALSRRYEKQMSLRSEWKATACAAKATSELWNKSHCKA